MSKLHAMLAVSGMCAMRELSNPNLCSGYGAELVGYDDGYELGGYGEEIVGDEEDMDQLIGAVAQAIQRRRGAAPARRPPQRVQMQAPRPQIQRIQNTSFRRYPLGLGATSIGAGATAVIQANPQLPFQVNRLVTPSTGLLIDNLQVGTASQFVAAGAVPVEVFRPDAVDVDLKGDTAVPGVAVQITISNPTAGALTFSGAIIGSVAQ